MKRTEQKENLKINKKSQGQFKVAGLLSGTKTQCINRLENLTSRKQVGYGTAAWQSACDKLRNHIKTAF